MFRAVTPILFITSYRYNVTDSLLPAKLDSIPVTVRAPSLADPLESTPVMDRESPFTV